MPVRVIRSTDYLEELLKIWDFQSKQSVEQADRLVAQFESTVERLGQFPDSGERTPQLGPRCRRVLAGKYVLVYDRHEDHVVVLHVYHSARNIHRLPDL